ncbi:GntR family transcriptional regulator [Rhizobium sp. RCAM05973]|uniref:GntR family transcriptional regulator n=1 Tax=Rhizobium sp. RCAM05973 TaxID=2994066 RepID=UPI0022EBA60A|nr:GntR family transcriptional regulator [Rhizobium sp. RCAM05973]
MARKISERPSRSLSDEAYDRLESMLISSELAPGARYTIQQLQEKSGLGRTPVHDAVKRLASNQLVHVSPRSGLLIAPVNLAQERTLLPLRTEIESLACGLASERATPHDQMVLRRFITDLEASESELNLARFNETDRLLNGAILKASGEPLLANTLIPLQTLYRRTGWIFHVHVAQSSSMRSMIADHVSLLKLILSGNREQTQSFVRKMMLSLSEVLQHVREHVDPSILDVRLARLDVRTGISSMPSKSRDASQPIAK